MRCLYEGKYPCGRCPACLANRQRAFCFRLDQEREACSFYFWLTLQYDDEHVPRFPDGEMCFSKQDCREFFEKIRKKYDHKEKKKRHFRFKHFLVSEYGSNGTKRPHYHCLLLVYSDLPLARLYPVKQEMKEYICNEAWLRGHVTEKSFHGRVLSYLTKYCTKPELTGDYHTMKTFTLISKGIGIHYLDQITEDHKQQMRDTLDFSVRYGNSKFQLPRYYVDKILPHSKAYLDSLEYGTPEYREVERVRKDLCEMQFQRDLKKYRLEQKQIESVGYDKFSKQKQAKIDDEFAYFRAKIRKRKDL